MGVITNTKQFLAKKSVNTARKAMDGIATLSALSPQQLEDIDRKRNLYLQKKPNMNGEETQLSIQKNMGAIGIEVYQAYLEQLGAAYTPIDTITGNFDSDNRIRYFDITKWVTDSEEQSLDKLVNVYHVLSEEECNIALIYNRTKEGCRISIGVVNTNESQSDPAIADNFYARILSAIKGNFPGADIIDISSNNDSFGIGIPECLENACRVLNDEGKVKSVSIVSNVASEKSEDFISQSMEKLLDGIVPSNKDEEYTIVLLAKPIRDQLESRNRLYKLYTDMSPYANWQTNYTYTQSDGISSSANFGVNLGVSAGANSIVNMSTGTNIQHTEGNGTSSSKSTGRGTIKSFFTSKGTTEGTSTNFSDLTGTSTTNGRSIGYNVSANFGVSFARASSVTAQIGMNEGISQSFTNFGVKHTLEIIESQLKRIEESSALGMWEFASYVISDSPVIANNVAHMYLALTQGEKSYLTKAAVNFWDGDINTEETRVILNSVKNLQHPVFGLKTSLEEDWLMYPTLVTPTTPMSGLELAKALNFPRKSVSGLPVMEVVPFGREPHSLQDTEMDLEIGSGYHMRKVIHEQRILLSKEELAKHTFITGSTGSGKSNTIYKILEKLGEEDVRFLVVEPAKGEYKDVIGRKKGVAVYGTNPNIENIAMLHLNPFRFPQHIHILEHLDRLIEIFNVCWPMYAAMPAILKDSIERAYVDAGWDLEKSVNRFDSELFPSFDDVLIQVKAVLNESDYSDDNKGDYTGSLVTRIKSLTNGINRILFSTDDIADKNLFDKNVIVDLSRIGSMETKSLIMGLLVLKLQEYRMEQNEPNSKLRHVTVLEEAHNILKRTSTEQTTEGTNLLGKSVEMLANAIAEMRTYGEGFIIADQSPGLLDMSVIRNTNTKIILRLPDYSDRELVGRASGLNEKQIIEIARLEQGVAAISQSDWLEPVLCKVDKYIGEGQPFLCSLKDTQDILREVKLCDANQSLLDCLMGKEIYRKGDRVDMRRIKRMILRSKIATPIKCDFLDYLNADKDDALSSLRKLIYDFLSAKKAIESSVNCDNITGWLHSVVDRLQPSINQYSKQQIDLVMALIIYEQKQRDASYSDIYYKFTELYKTKGGVF